MLSSLLKQESDPLETSLSCEKIGTSERGGRYFRQAGRRRRTRPLRIELLETRRLLAAEGSAAGLSIDAETLGLHGELSAHVDWADGSQSSAEVSGGIPNGRVYATIDYRFDTRGFFTTPRRRLLESVVDSVLSRIDDRLDAIVPGGQNRWTLQFPNPSGGGNKQVANVTIRENELRLFVGSRPLSGNALAVAGPGGYRDVFGFPDFLEAVQTRGQPNAIGSDARDFSTWGGILTFSSTADWYFGADPAGIQSDQADFVTTAAHEMFHVLGFGVAESWKRLAVNDEFRGSAAVAAYDGSGYVPLEPDEFHWAEALTDDGMETLLDPNQLKGQRKVPTRLDYAALDDIGWDVIHRRATVNAEHVYADDGTYPVGVTLRGSELGRSEKTESLRIHNVAPQLELRDGLQVLAGMSLEIENFGQISDPGYRNPAGDPPTEEVFTYTIDWGDGSPSDAGAAHIDRHGSPGNPTRASFDGQHIFAETGSYVVDVVVRDDDGGRVERSVTVEVIAPPRLELQLSRWQVDENTVGSVLLTAQRSGGFLDEPLTVSLFSNDPSEATVPTSLTFAAGESIASVEVTVVDDTLLDGTQMVTFTASGPLESPATATLEVRDAEQISVELLDEPLVENAGADGARLRVRRSNTDIETALEVKLTGLDPDLFVAPEPVVIPTGSTSVIVRLIPRDDDIPEPPQFSLLTFEADGYAGDTLGITLFDDEPPYFQNPQQRLDVDGDGRVRPIDALRVINQLNRFGGPRLLDPATDSRESFVDVNGDYFISPIDALTVINAINRGDGEGESESAAWWWQTELSHSRSDRETCRPR